MAKSGVDFDTCGVDTPETVMTTRAPAVLKILTHIRFAVFFSSMLECLNANT